MKSSEIKIKVDKDEKNIPESIKWTATDAPKGEHEYNAKAMFLSFFDKDYRDTMRMELWTKDMQIQEMDRLVYYSLNSLADSYFKATSNKELAEHMRQFARFFGEQTEILPKSKESSNQ